MLSLLFCDRPRHGIHLLWLLVGALECELFKERIHLYCFCVILTRCIIQLESLELVIRFLAFREYLSVLALPVLVIVGVLRLLFRNGVKTSPDLEVEAKPGTKSSEIDTEQNHVLCLAELITT